MAATPNVPTPSPSQMAGGASVVPPPFGRPSERPDEPITTGVNIGPGPGQEILPVQHQDATVQPGPMTQMLAALSASDTTGVLADLLAQAKGINA